MMVQPSQQAARLATQAVDVAGGSDVGRVRRVNEDSWIAAPDIGLYAVADGMGGHGAGDVASQLAVRTLQEQLQSSARTDQAGNSALESALLRAVASANKVVRDENRQAGFGEGTGMGTTLVGLFGDLACGHILAFNIGDSRLYRYRDGELTQLTHDHTLYQEWLESGQDGPAPPRNIILRALGLFDDLELDLLDVEALPGDLLLLCSDGLSGMLDDQSLDSSLKGHARHSLATINQQLIDQANAKGGDDNISLITLRLS